MHFVEWDDSMSTGIAEIDEQHRELLQKFNELAGAIENQRGSAVIRKIVDYLQIYAAWHFKHEEECMDFYRCPMAETNRRAHIQFLKKFGHFFDLVHQDGSSDELALKVYWELTHWLVNHICRVDAGLNQCVHEVQE